MEKVTNSDNNSSEYAYTAIYYDNAVEVCVWKEGWLLNVWNLADRDRSFENWAVKTGLVRDNEDPYERESWVEELKTDEGVLLRYFRECVEKDKIYSFKNNS